MALKVLEKRKIVQDNIL